MFWSILFWATIALNTAIGGITAYCIYCVIWPDKKDSPDAQMGPLLAMMPITIALAVIGAWDVIYFKWIM